MPDYQLVIIGAGLSGLAAGIRAARFGRKTLILEQHSRPGGLNSWYFRKGYLLETGLHAMTNFAPSSVKGAPLNRLFRQLKISRKKFITREQLGSEIVFPEKRLQFSNDLSLLTAEIEREFPAALAGFIRLIRVMEDYNPFLPAPWQSARAFLSSYLADSVLENMLMLPLMVYGNPEERDMDLGQFAIMFRAIFLEGFFRPEQTIREFINMLLEQYHGFGGVLRMQTRVAEITRSPDGQTVVGVRLDSGEEIRAESLLSTAGIPVTARLVGWPLALEKYTGRMSFMESIAILPARRRQSLSRDRTIIFFSHNDDWQYKRPESLIDPSWGVICFPDNFHGLALVDTFQLRLTNAAYYDCWQQLDRAAYQDAKKQCFTDSTLMSSQIVGDYNQDIIYQDSFTPLSIERYTGKGAGAVYGSPIKIKDGRTPWNNLFIAGTDQGYLGIVGAMLSGVSIVNQHLLDR